MVKCGTQFGTQKGAERAVEAVDAAHAVRIFFQEILCLLILKDFTRGRALLDTVGVWGSNPHAPTNSTYSHYPHFSLRQITPFEYYGLLIDL